MLLFVGISGEYRAIVGEFIPYNQLGFPDLHAFIETIPDVVRIGRYVLNLLRITLYHHGCDIYEYDHVWSIQVHCTRDYFLEKISF